MSHHARYHYLISAILPDQISQYVLEQHACLQETHGDDEGLGGLTMLKQHNQEILIDKGMRMQSL